MTHLTDKDPNLAISFTSFNRPEIFKENLHTILPLLKKYKVPIYIFDDSTNTAVENVYNEIQRDYSSIYYERNNKTLGHDLNALKAITKPSSDFVWYLGDSMVFDETTLDMVITNLQNAHDQDFIFLNSHSGRAFYEDLPSRNFYTFLVNMSWHLTLSGATIYSSKVISQLSEKKVSISKYKNFLQLGLIYEYYMEKKSVNFVWLQNSNVSPNVKKVTYWRYKVLSVFCEDWHNLIVNSGVFDISDLKFVLMSHSRETRLFSLRNIIAIKADDALHFGELYKNFSVAQKVFVCNAYAALLISLIPSIFLTPLVNLGRKVVSMKRANLK